MVTSQSQSYFLQNYGDRNSMNNESYLLHTSGDTCLGRDQREVAKSKYVLHTFSYTCLWGACFIHAPGLGRGVRHQNPGARKKEPSLKGPKFTVDRYPNSTNDVRRLRRPICQFERNPKAPLTRNLRWVGDGSVNPIGWRRRDT